MNLKKKDYEIVKDTKNTTNIRCVGIKGIKHQQEEKVSFLIDKSQWEILTFYSEIKVCRE